MKRGLKSALASRLIGALIAGYLKLVWHSSRFAEHSPAHVDDLLARDQAIILAFWHSRVALPGFALRPGMRVRPLISRHMDGGVLARVIEKLGFEPVRGSTRDQQKAKDKGGVAALREMLNTLKAGGHIAITPDGPRGPRMRAGLGLVTLARISGAPVLPMAYSTSRQRVLKTWDRFVLPYPFSRGVFVFGPPIHVPRDLDDGAIEAMRSRIEEAINLATREADRLAGQPLIEPAALPEPSLE